MFALLEQKSCGFLEHMMLRFTNEAEHTSIFYNYVILTAVKYFAGRDVLITLARHLVGLLET